MLPDGPVTRPPGEIPAKTGLDASQRRHSDEPDAGTLRWTPPERVSRDTRVTC